MLKLRKAAITGGVSCGKSEVCRFLQELGAYTVSADTIVHQLLSPDTKLGRQVIDLLGSEIVVEGQIDRKKVAEKVFTSRGLLDKLEKIIHPAVYEAIENEYLFASKKGAYALFVAEIPLLFETGGERFFDKTFAVVADEDKCKKRSKSDDYDLRMERQLSQEEKAKRADIVITNNGSIEDLKKQAEEIFRNLTNQNAF